MNDHPDDDAINSDDDELEGHFPAEDESFFDDDEPLDEEEGVEERPAEPADGPTAGAGAAGVRADDDRRRLEVAWRAYLANFEVGPPDGPRQPLAPLSEEQLSLLDPDAVQTYLANLQEVGALITRSIQAKIRATDGVDRDPAAAAEVRSEGVVLGRHHEYIELVQAHLQGRGVTPPPPPATAMHPAARASAGQQPQRRMPGGLPPGRGGGPPGPGLSGPWPNQDLGRLDGEDLLVAMKDLAVYVEWLTSTYGIAEYVPPCWYLHRPLVDDLAALRWMYYWFQNAEGERQTVSWFQFTAQLQAAIVRWRDLWHVGTCRTKHSPTQANEGKWHPQENAGSPENPSFEERLAQLVNEGFSSP